jgi:putative (di)nucleoside polyphosphate hydrolase
MSGTKALPYRLGVGMAVFNTEGRVFVGHRIDSGKSPKGGWQMPQGGLTPGEEPYSAALRELHEETHISSVTLLGQSPTWYAYDLPHTLQKNLWQGRYRGQKQKWFAFRFTGCDSEINIHLNHAHDTHPEFDDWKWEELHKLPSLIVSFKRTLYERVALDFQIYADQEKNFKS